MPRYEYRCPDGHTTTRWAEMGRAPEAIPRTCACGKLAERVISAPMLRHDGAYSYEDRRGAA